ncbi:MAG: hypothetical protein IPH84_13795 [Bacteroidales bacterium]|nr:hypothetical protein [Bacteroidales bacterium]
MKTTYKFPLFLISFILIQLFLSCKHYSVGKKAQDWIAYKPGQVYLFQEENGNQDTLKILKVVRYNNPEDHLAIFSPYHEKIVIEASVPDLYTNPMGTTFHSSVQSIIVLDANHSNTTIDISYQPYGYYFESRNNDVADFRYEKRTLGNRSYDDIIVFKCNNESAVNKEKAMNEIIWSAENGIVEYNLGHRKFTLKERIK